MDYVALLIEAGSAVRNVCGHPPSDSYVGEEIERRPEEQIHPKSCSSHILAFLLSMAPQTALWQECSGLRISCALTLLAAPLARPSRATKMMQA